MLFYTRNNPLSSWYSPSRCVKGRSARFCGLALQSTKTPLTQPLWADSTSVIELLLALCVVFLSCRFGLISRNLHTP